MADPIQSPDPTSPALSVRRSVANLFTANMVSFAAVGLSYLVYSRLLSPVEFGLYSTALVIGSFGQLVLDGGLKNTLIKSLRPPDRSEQLTLLLLMLAVSAALTAGLAFGYPVIGRGVHVSQADYGFLATFGAIWLLSYPWLAIPTAYLERGFRYRRLAVVESTGQVLERATPALLLLLTPLGIWSFVVGLALGRLFRIAGIALAQPIPLSLRRPAPLSGVLHFIAEGAWLQGGVVASLVRDSLHVLMIGPLFGPAWVGYYGWVLQLALVSSQAFVQISARVSIPMFAQTEKAEDRWSYNLQQVKLLAMLTAPVLGAVLLTIPSVNAHLFHDKWAPALYLLPLVFLRMLPGLATTPVGALVMVERGGRTLAGLYSAWTAAEIVVALVLCLLIGPTGLAWSYSVMAWFGLWLQVGSLRRAAGTFRQTARAILERPSLAPSVAVPLVAWLVLGRAGLASIALLPTLAAGALLPILAYSLEGDLRRHARMISARLVRVR